MVILALLLPATAHGSPQAVWRAIEDANRSRASSSRPASWATMPRLFSDTPMAHWSPTCCRMANASR